MKKKKTSSIGELLRNTNVVKIDPVNAKNVLGGTDENAMGNQMRPRTAAQAQTSHTRPLTGFYNEAMASGA